MRRGLLLLLLISLAAACGDDAGNSDDDGGIGKGVDLCGNQFAFGINQDYETLAGVFADDRLILNTQTLTCNQYLAQEANLFGAVVVADCGGRTPVMDVVDRTYSLLVSGSFDSAIGDGVSNDECPGHTIAYQNGNFPLLARPVGTATPGLDCQLSSANAR